MPRGRFKGTKDRTSRFRTPASRCVECPESRTYKRVELHSRKKMLYCEYHLAQVSLIKCFKCPTEHPGWLRSELVYSRTLAYCPDHRPIPKNQVEKPKCPDCGSEFDYYVWKGTVEATTINCFCGFAGKALDYDDAVTIKVLASPVEYN